MTHELKKIVSAYESTLRQGQKSVLATVVSLNGSSYRGPGVRMLIFENGDMVGAVSGGCVEKEIYRQAESVFKTQIPKVMSYDGRYRLGCEGMLYILIEPFTPNQGILKQFKKTLFERNKFAIISYYIEKDSVDKDYGSKFYLECDYFLLQKENEYRLELAYFTQIMEPLNRLIILGAEHDAVQLCTYAAMTGWEVTVVAPPSEEKDISHFPGASYFIACAPETYEDKKVDEQTAIIFMTHSYVKDLKYLLALKDVEPAYIGLLGPSKRREKLLNEFIEYVPEVSDAFFDCIHGPAGIDIGAETPQEIAISIMAEILSVLRTKQPIKLKDKDGSIHS